MDNTTTNVQGWISVKDRLPENKQVVLIFGKVPSFYGSQGPSVMTAKFYLEDKWNKQSFMHHRDEATDVTHWQPLPEPPTEGLVVSEGLIDNGV